MKIFHKHIWKEIARTYQPSEWEVVSANSMGRVEIKGHILSTNSFTTILWECQDKSCQETRKEILNGKIV